MTYTPDVPQANQQIANTQLPILQNFTYIQDAMQEDHAWNGNEIAGQADGTHQQVSFPNQPSDIASLGTGIAAVEYAIGGNLYSWNGAKNPVSGVSGSGSLTLTNANYVDLFSIPTNCIGYVFVNYSPFLSFPCISFGFFSIAGSPDFYSAEIPKSYNASPNPLLQISATQSPGTIQLKQFNTNTTLITYKYIYWPI